MRGTILLGALLLGLAAPAAGQVSPAPDAFWTATDERLSFKPAQLSVPRRIGGAEYYETSEFSRKGEGVDTAVKFRSADQKIFATLYVYYPSLSHSGVQAIATDQAIRSARSPNIRALGSGLAPAGGKPGVAVTADYEHYLGDNHSKAAFIKAGRWMLKLRVTGPESRSAEVAAIMKAMLDGLRFEGEVHPTRATPISVGECPAAARPDAKVIATGGGDAATIAIIDAAGGAAGKGPGAKPARGRIGRNWCRTALPVGNQSMAVLQSTGEARAGGRDVDSALLVLYSDAGGVLEVIRMKDGTYLMLHHGIGEVNVLDSYDRLPSLAQIGRFFAEPVQIRARVRLRPDGNASVELPGATSQPDPAPGAGKTTD